MFSRPVMIDGSPKVRLRGRPIKMMEDDDVITTSSDIFTRSLNGEGPNVIPGVELMLSLRTLGMNMCPEGLRDYMDRIEFFNPRQLVGCVNSLECAIMNIPCVVQTKAGWERIVDMKIPPHMKIKHLDVGDVHAIGYRTENGMVSLGGTRVERVIDYIVPKYDGLLVVCVGFKTATSVFTVVLSSNGCDIIHDSYFSLSGELMYQSDIMAFYGNMFQEFVPSKLKIGGIEYNVKPNVPMTINDFLDAKPEPYVDGYIISIDCVEYKIKERNTIDIFYNGRFLESSDHVRYNILSGKDKLIEYGVYECYGSVDGVHVMKYRRDKTVVQSAAEVKSIFCAADCTYMRQIVPKNCPMQNESSHDVVCIQEMIQKVTDELVAGEHPVAVVTAKNVKEILHRNLITYDLSELSVVTQNIRSDGVTNDRQTSIDKTKIKTIKREFKYASCATIYKVMTDMMYEGHPRFIAKKIAYKLNVRVSPRKIFLMGCRGELFFSQFGLRVKMINKRVLPYVYNGYVPHEFVDNKTDVKMALMNYNKFNDTKFALDKDMEAFTRELIELRDICDDEAILEEVGDVFTVLVKLCMRLTGCRTEIYNGNNPIWRVLLSSPALVPYKIKMRKRLEEYGCIRHHKTSESHVCSNGIPFVPVRLELEKYDDVGDNDRCDNSSNSGMKCD